jgi:GT2 family glycosyltransferase
LNPELSIIIASYNAKGTISACLRSLENQKTDRRFEVIVVDSSTDGTGVRVEKEFPGFRLYRFSKRNFCGDARNRGISVAKAEIVAFIDADCVADPNWVEEILKAHELPVPAIGGAIGNGNPESYVGWAGYFCEFSRWMPGSRAGPSKDIAGANMSYKKRVFDDYGKFIEGVYCSDTEFHWRLGDAGFFLRFVPNVVVHHRNIDGWKRLICHEFSHGRYFARMRTEKKRFTASQRMLYVFLSPLIPLKLFLEIGLMNLRNRRFLLRFLGASPAVFLALVCWALGECAGYGGDWKNEYGCRHTEDFDHTTTGIQF